MQIQYDTMEAEDIQEQRAKKNICILREEYEQEEEENYIIRSF